MFQQQRTLRHGPEALGRVVIGQRDPVGQRPAGPRVHRRRHLRLALEAVRLELGDRLRRVVQHMAVRRQDEIDLMRVAGAAEPVERIDGQLSGEGLYADIARKTIGNEARELAPKYAL